jgi:hypothetical protein
VIGRREVTRLLRKVDRPRAPHPMFARELRAELLGRESTRQPRVDHEDGTPEITVLPEALPQRQRPRRRLAVAAVVLALVGGGTWLVASQGGDDTVIVAVSPETKRTVEEACARFKAAAFGEVDRVSLLGPRNDDVLARPDARDVVARLASALAAFGSDLRDAGIDDQTVTVTVERATGRADTARRNLETGRSTLAPGDLTLVDLDLAEVERQLVVLGIADSCL